MKSSIYENITAEIVAAIEEGAGLYRMPWHRSRADLTNPMNVASGRSYRGLNIVTLWITAEARGYASGTWATYQQWKEAGAQVRKGEKSASVFFWKDLRQGKEGSEREEDRPVFVARGYSVFNADQVEGYEAPSVPPLSEAQRIDEAEQFFAAVPATVEHGGNMACYTPASDTVRMVPYEQFVSATAYYATLAHELTHWSGAAARLDRDLTNRFGTESYAMEELVAELGAAFISGRLSLPSEPRRDHAPYIASWLRVLRNDPRAIFTAATKAQAAADFLASFSESGPDD